LNGKISLAVGIGSKNNTTNQVLIELPSNVRNVKARGTA